MHAPHPRLQGKTVPQTSITSLLAGSKVVALLALLYVAAATVSAWNVIIHTQASTQAIEQILSTYNMKNEGAQALVRFDKDHPIIGTLFSSTAEHELELPSHAEAAHALNSGIAHLLRTVRQEASVAAWWSWFLINLSLLYVTTLIALSRSFSTRSVLFGLTTVSVFCFFIGILAPAMVIWTTPSIALESGKLDFVLQHEVRGIAAIIWELLTNGHWIVGGLLLLFSILTPLTKACLTFFITGCRSQALNYRIGQFLHTIGKWSMADVFVAGVLLSLYALKAQEATKSIPCLGLYYFIGYCLLSLTATELLVQSGIAAKGGEKKATRKSLPRGVIIGLFAGYLCFVAGSGGYTYQQYTVNTREKVEASSSPQKLNNADLVLPAHK